MAPQLHGAVPLAVLPLAYAQGPRRAPAFGGCHAGHGPEGGAVAGMEAGSERLRPVVEDSWVDTEDRTEFVVPGEGAGEKVPVEQAGPHRGGGGGRGLDGDLLRVTVEGIARTGPEGRQAGAEPVGDGPQLTAPVLGQPVTAVWCRPYDRQRPERLPARAHRHGTGAEGVRQSHRELGIPARRLIGAGQVDRASGAERRGDRNRTADRDTAPAAQQRRRRAAARGEHDRTAVAGAEKDAPGVRARRLHGLDDGCCQHVLALRRRVHGQPAHAPSVRSAGPVGPLTTRCDGAVTGMRAAAGAVKDRPPLRCPDS